MQHLDEVMEAGWGASKLSHEGVEVPFQSWSIERNPPIRNRFQILLLQLCSNYPDLLTSEMSTGGFFLSKHLVG